MKVSLWRPSYLAHINKHIQVSTWAIDKPTSDVLFNPLATWEITGNSVGYLPTLRDVRYSLSETSRNVVGSAIQDLYVLCRLDRTIPFHNLPTAFLEGYHATFSVVTQLKWRDIVIDPTERGLLSFEWLSCNPVSIAPVGDFNSDYIAELVWSASITFIADPETGVMPPPFTVKQVGGRVFRSKLEDMQVSILDFDSLLKDDN
jgi:hypothetical protein